MTLNELCTAAHTAAVEKGWYERPRELPELLMLIVTELAEAVEADRAGWKSYKEPIIVEQPEEEVWKPITWIDGSYMVSNYGNVLSTDRFVWNGKTMRVSHGKMLSPGMTKPGYFTVSIGGKSRKIHHLVARAFIGNGHGLVCNHKNGDKTCNWSTNLEWCSSKENNIHAIYSGLRNRYTGALSYNDYVDIAFRFKRGETAPSIHLSYADKVGLSAIKNIRQRGVDRYTQSVEFEIADAVIRIADLCGNLGIDLEAHVAAKMEYNKYRPHKHGKAY